MNSTKDSERMKTVPAYIIAVDGYSSCGKSTFARLIAQELSYIYIDSGAMYRAVALYCMENILPGDDNILIEELKKLLPGIHISYRLNDRSGLRETWLNGRNVEEKIRGIDVAAMASKISKIKEVRSKLVDLQRKIGSNGGVVMDGRDIGTVVFPDAHLKIFMTADPDVRAMRRFKELTEKGMDVNLGEIAENIRTRDREDENRKESPLRKAEDALVLDNSDMTIQQQMEWFRRIWNKTLHEHEH
jgi:cytidylate kinase